MGDKMRDIAEREKALNMYFHEGKGYGEVAYELNLSENTIKSWCRRYRIKNEIPERGKAPLSKEPVKRERLHVTTPKDKDSTEARIARLEMEVDLLRNFLILAEGE